MGQQIKKVNFAHMVHPTRHKVEPVVRTIEGKRGDVFVHAKTPTRLLAKQKTEKFNSKSCLSTKPIRSEYRTRRQENEKQDDKLETARVAEKVPFHSKSCPRSSLSKQRSKYSTSPVLSPVSDESIHSESCPMRSQNKEKNNRNYSSSLTSDESIHSAYCPMRSKPKQQKCKLHTSGEYCHSETCPMRSQSNKKKIRNYQNSYVYSETYPVRLQKNLKYRSTTSEESIHSESCPMRSASKQHNEKRECTSRISDRYSESLKLRLPGNEKAERKYQTTLSKKSWTLEKTIPELPIRRNCLEDFKKMTRYLKLKQKALEAMKKGKIFTVKGKNAMAVRKALLDRGWVEKLSLNKTNTNNSKMTSDKQEKMILSSFLDEHNPNLVWGGINSCNGNGLKKWDDAIINTLEVKEVWSTKESLCKTLHNTSWYYIENVAEVDAPRTYSNVNRDELGEFIKDYLLTACTSLLRWILLNVEKNKPVFKKSGTISTNVIIFAINRCKEFLFMKENLDVDKKISTEVTPGQWKFFLTKYASLVSGKALFQIDKDRNMLILIAYAKCLIDRIIKIRPQLSCEGCCNIWIVKPSECSSGKGVKVSSDLDAMLNMLTKTQETYVVQKYIETPLLIYKMKFYIRQYYLITSPYPLEIWTYQDCFLKFGSQNDSVNTHYEPAHRNSQAGGRRHKNSFQRHLGLSKNNLCELKTFKNYLTEIGEMDVWENVIYSGMKKIIVGIMLSNQDSLKYTKNRFGFYCCDFILDEDFRPWLIEINNSPDLHPSTNVRICHRVVSDIIKVVIDHADNRKASTGKFECIYRQPITPPVPTYENSVNTLVVKGVAIASSYFDKGNEIVKRECNRNENIKIPRNIEYFNDKELKMKISEQPDLNLLQKLDSLFELAVMKKSANDMQLNLYKKRSAFIMQTYSGCIANAKTGPDNDNHMDLTPGYNYKDTAHKVQVESEAITEPTNYNNLKVKQDSGASTFQTQTNAGWMTEPGYEGNLDVYRDKKASVCKTQTDAGWLTVPHYDDYLAIKPNKRARANDIQKDSSLIREPEFDGFGYYNLNIDRYKETNFYMTQTESNPRIERNDDHHVVLISDIKKTYKLRIGPNAKIECDNENYKTDKEIYPYTKQTEPRAITKSDYGDNLDVNPIDAYN